MTAVNLIVQSHASHLITDAAYYDGTGRMVEVRTKTCVAERHRMAIGCSGCVKDWHVARFLAGLRDQAAVLDAMPEAVAMIRADNAAQHPGGEGTGYNELMLFVAMWSDRADRAEGWVIASDRGYLGAAYQPGTLVEVEQLSSPPLPYVDATSFDPASSGSGMLQRQREDRTTFGEVGAFVGGFGELTTVTRHSIVKQRLCEWPDKVGEPIAA